MRRTRSLLLAASAAAAALLGSACGVLSDTTAATVLGRAVPVESVEELARDEGFVGGGVQGITDSKVPGDVFRSVLQFELQRVAWVAEAERWGLEITEDDLRTAREQVDSQLEANGLEYEASTRDKIVELVAAQGVLNERFSRLDPDSDDDLRRLYDGLPALWDQACAAVTYVPAESEAEVRRALRDGTSIEELPDVVEGTSLVLDPGDRCVSSEQIPDELDEAFRSATTGRDVGPVVVPNPNGGESLYVFRIDERRRLDFADAREDLAEIADSLAQQGAQSWISLVVSSTAEVNPRYGSAVTMSGMGEPLVLAPPTPIAAPVEPEPVPEPGIGGTPSEVDHDH